MKDLTNFLMALVNARSPDLIWLVDSLCKMQAEEDLLWLSSQIQPATACDCIELMSCSAFKYLLGQVSWGYAFSWSIPFVGAL